MAKVFVLHINDNIVGPCLELIRKVCNPESTSRPHITVRYLKKLGKNDLDIYKEPVPDVSFLGPDEFTIDGKGKKKEHVIFIKCASDSLEVLSHKPDYPDSVFHVTLYEGGAEDFAKKVKNILAQFNWNFVVELPPNTTLTAIELKSSNGVKSPKTKDYSEEIVSLYERLFSDQLTKEKLLSLSDEDRLEKVKIICKYLHERTQNYQKIEGRMGPSVITDSVIPDDKSKWTGDADRVNANQNGFFLTPPELALEIAQYAVDLLEPKEAKIEFGNPAVGTGVFFGALIKQVPEDRIKSAVGIEVVQQRALATLERWSHKGLDVLNGDYLHMDELPRRNLILANPPYVRYQHIDKDYGQRLRQRASIDMGMQISGQAGLYVYFLLLSHSWMTENAVAAWLVPAEFMDTNYGSSVRDYLTKKVELVRLHRFDFKDTQFENALVSSAILVFRNKKPRDGHRAIFSSGGSLKLPDYAEEVEVKELHSEDKWSIPRIKKKKNNTPKLGDLFSVCRGIATGANDFFIMARSVAQERGIPEEFLRPILPKARTLDGDVVERGLDGYPKVSNQLCMIDCDLPLEKIEKQYPDFYQYLRGAIDSRIIERTLVRRRTPWYKQEKRNPPMYVCTYMGRGSEKTLPIRFIWNKSDAVVTNSYLILYPNERLAEILGEDERRQEDMFRLLQKTALKGFEGYGRMYGGGLQKIEPRELLRVRMADFPGWIEPAVEGQLFGL